MPGWQQQRRNRDRRCWWVLPPSGRTVGAKLLHAPPPSSSSSSSPFIPQSRADAEKQKLLAVLEGLRRVLGEQESRFLIRLGRLRRGLEEQRRGETAELARLRQRRTELQTKCRQTDSDLLRVSQTLPPNPSAFPLLAFIPQQTALSISLPSSPGCPNHLEQVPGPKSITRNGVLGPKSSFFGGLLLTLHPLPAGFLLLS